MDFECIVVGAGPAGLSAALTLGRARRRTLVLDSGKPRNHAARAMHGVLGHDGLSPAALKARGIEEVGRYGIEVRSADVSEARALDDGGFEIDGITADTIILATGMLDDTPPVEGFAEIYGISAHTCPYCDGFEHGDTRIAVYAAGEAAEHMGPLLRQWSDDVIVLDPADVTRFVSTDGRLTHVELAGGESIERDALFFHVGMQPRADLAVHARLRADRGRLRRVGARRIARPRSTASTPSATAPTRCSTCRCRSPTAPAPPSSSTSACSTCPRPPPTRPLQPNKTRSSQKRDEPCQISAVRAARARCRPAGSRSHGRGRSGSGSTGAARARRPRGGRRARHRA